MLARRRFGSWMWLVVSGALTTMGCGGTPDSTDARGDAPILSLDCSSGSTTAGAAAVTTRGCASCHGADLGGALTGTPGSNLTPSGVGAATDGELAAAILDGRSLDGSPLCVSMLRYRTAGMTEAQACDIVAHLRSLAPVTRSVPDTCM